MGGGAQLRPLFLFLPKGRNHCFMDIINAKIFPMDGPCIENGYVRMENGLVRAVGPMRVYDGGEDAETLDAGGGMSPSDGVSGYHGDPL